ncbi:hypothetical protein FRC07_006704 [Ceratobasidium sp. 392]|nr:hypothetical protein FRC07_006704 [Ceratobasidium sp. 392]
MVYLALGATPSTYYRSNADSTKRRVTAAIWVFSMFLLDFSTTTTTIVYLYRSYAGLDECNHKDVFNTIWQVIWLSCRIVSSRKASAAPPLIITFIPLVNQFIAHSVTNPLTIFPITLTGKFFLLSLMISLVGRGYIREKFDQLARSTTRQDATVEHTERTAPTFPPETPVVYELEAIRHSLSHRPSGASTLGTDQLQQKSGRANSLTETSSGHSSPKVTF